MISYGLSLLAALLLASTAAPATPMPMLKKRPPDVVGTPRPREPGKVLFRGRLLSLEAARAIVATEKSEAERRRAEARARIAARRAEAEKQRRRDREKAEARALWARYAARRGVVHPALRVPYDLGPRAPYVWTNWDGRLGWWPRIPCRRRFPGWPE